MRLSSKTIGFIVTTLLLATSAYSLPKSTRTLLPFPENMEAGDEEIAKAALTLELYQDSLKKNHYYYVPPFHIRQYAKGDASTMFHTHRIKNYAETNELLRQRAIFSSEYTLKRLEELKQDAHKKKEFLLKSLELLEKAIENGNLMMIDLRKAIASNAQAEYQEAQKDLDQAQDNLANHQSILPAGLGRSYLERALINLAAIGIALPFSGEEEPKYLMEGIYRALAEISDSYGGYLSFNAYGGFTKEQLTAIRLFKNKYTPDLKITLLPVEKLEFFSLTQTESMAGKTKLTNIFRHISGSGDYLGSTIVLDTSVSGAMGFASHLAPFILPVGIKATIKRQSNPTHARFSCDFSNGFFLSGKQEIRPKFLIFGKEIINQINAEDQSSGACKLELLSGNRDSAEYRAVEVLHQKLTDLFATRTILTREEKEAYYRMVIEQAGKKSDKARNEENVLVKAAKAFLSAGWAGVAIEGLSWATDSFWQVNEHDVSSLSKVKFTDEIYVQPDEVITKELPTNLCLVYNQEISAYDRCTEQEELEAKGMMESIEDIRRSPECANIFDPFLCGQRRDQAGLTTNKDRKPPIDGNDLPLQI